jgi:hypothetical protein
VSSTQRKLEENKKGEPTAFFKAKDSASFSVWWQRYSPVRSPRKTHYRRSQTIISVSPLLAKQLYGMSLSVSSTFCGARLA